MRPLLLLLSLCACRPGPDVEEAAFSAEIEATEIPTVWRVSWTPDESGTSFIEYGQDEAFDLRTPDLACAEGACSSLLLGLKAGHDYQWRAVTQLASGERLTSPAATLALDPAPQDLPAVTLSSVDEARLQPGGFVMVGLIQPTGGRVAILDREGDWVWFSSALEGLVTSAARVGADGESILYASYDAQQKDDVGKITRLGLDGTVLSETRTPMAHHAFTELPEGGFAYLGMESREVEVEGEPGLVLGDLLLEVEEGATSEAVPEPVFAFHDDYGQSPWPVCSHYTFSASGNGAADWTHANSLTYEPAERAYYLMSRNMDALLKIDRDSGALLWQMGGLYSTMSPETEDARWDHAHYSEREGNRILLFDNGSHRDPEASRLAVMSWDESAMTWKLEWEYWDPSGRYVEVLGDLHQLENGNYLASWTTSGLLTEITEGGEIVWQAELALGTASGRIRYIPDLYAP